MFTHLRIILVNPTHPGNIGATARAIKNMGFFQLYLVSPLKFPSEEARARASGAEDILENAVVVNTLEEALVDCHMVVGLSSRSRKISWPTLEARQAAEFIAKELYTNKASNSINTSSNEHNTSNNEHQNQIALVFGQEQSGLLNEELAKCNYQVTIAANPNYASLNLAQAVQVLTYECRMAFLNALNLRTEQYQKKEVSKDDHEYDHFHAQDSDILATQQDLECYYERLEEVLVRLQFLDPAMPRHLMMRLRRLYAKAKVDKTELNILQGILTAVEKKLGNKEFIV